ncbi:GMC oxidoreductase [Pseudoroseicyclus tamaricis]|uniref:GMC family oxidoreductase n=1 Tax=Pseudoroseicyclus tamaricis TaxID=2705421 RepID=A0A6B2JT91_9RHOB|nr:GMC family oxidoreductase [Pseudoroseicyclus tamaricis]NDU99383.1 GMC family oxidoreductase [Pseudoroseicyclus tamaricis]
MRDPAYDAIVIGSGPSGSFAAKELTEQGLTVLMLEAGPKVGPEQFDPARKPAKPAAINVIERAMATLKGQGAQARAPFYRGMFSQFYVSDRDHPYTTPKDAPYIWIRGRQAGGRSHTFGRVLMRWSDDDFRAHSLTGNGVDWPISYDDLAPYYDEVEGFLGLYGNADGVESLPDPVAKHPAHLSPAEEAFKANLERRFPARHAVAWRAVAPTPDRIFPPLRAALETGLLTIRYDSIAARILTEGGRATGVEVIDRESRARETLRADQILCAASPIETIRLLFNSADEAHPDGLGNSAGLLGRYFMDQLPMLGLGAFPEVPGWAEVAGFPEDPFYDPSGGIFIPRFDRASPDRGEFSFQGAIGRSPVPEGDPSALLFFGFGQMQPHADNRVMLDPRKKDRWGLPAPHIICKIRGADHALLAEQEEAFLSTINGAGGVVEFLGSPHGIREWGRGAYPDESRLMRFLFKRFFHRVMVMGAGIHECGGARMGNDPAVSVTDDHGRLWDVQGVTLVDASTFAGSGVSGTTLTIMAQAVRSARAIARATNRRQAAG